MDIPDRMIEEAIKAKQKAQNEPDNFGAIFEGSGSAKVFAGIWVAKAEDAKNVPFLARALVEIRKSNSTLKKEHELLIIDTMQESRFTTSPHTIGNRVVTAIRFSTPIPVPEAGSTQTIADEDKSFNDLVEELVALSQESFDWGLENGFRGEYPLDARARRLGELIHAKAGSEGMEEAARILRNRVITRDGGGQCFMITYNWQDIGGWRP
jgi:hypothetical protein